jgi:hypothetical protein
MLVIVKEKAAYPDKLRIIVSVEMASPAKKETPKISDSIGQEKNRK